MELALIVIASLFLIASFIANGRIARDKVTALMAIGAAAALAKNLLTDNMFWAGVAATGLVLLTGATVSYSREIRKAKTEDAR